MMRLTQPRGLRRTSSFAMVNPSIGTANGSWWNGQRQLVEGRMVELVVEFDTRGMRMRHWHRIRKYPPPPVTG